MTKRDPSQFAIDTDVALGPVGTRGPTKRLAELDVQAAKQILCGADLRAVAEAFAPEYAVGAIRRMVERATRRKGAFSLQTATQFPFQLVRRSEATHCKFVDFFAL